MRLLFLLLFTVTAFADDSAYNAVRDNVFWPTLYNEAYETLYCGEPRAAGDRVTVEHVYAADWIAEALGCENRNSCDNDTYRTASSDLHNL
jgi:deoxyribonuclease I